MSKHVIGKEAENTQCLGNVFLSLLFSFVHFLSTLYGFLPFPILGAMNQNPSYISTIKLMAESLLRNFFLHILLTRKDRAGWGERCYVISGKCLKLQIRPVPTIWRNIVPASVLFPPNPFSHPRLESIANRL